MLMKLISWLMTFILAFSLGTRVNAPEKETDSELQQKVQDHMDVIVDEAAAILDEVSDEVRKNEKVQKAEEFVDNVKEIAQNTADDIKAHFGTEDETAAAEEEAPVEEVPAAAEAPAVSPTPAPVLTPVPVFTPAPVATPAPATTPNA